MKDTDAIAKIIKEAMAIDFKNLAILDVHVIEGHDADGDKVLHVKVLLGGTPSHATIARLSSVVRLVRPRLLAAKQEAFPVFSFISKQDLGANHFAAA